MDFTFHFTGARPEYTRGRLAEEVSIVVSLRLRCNYEMWEVSEPVEGGNGEGETQRKPPTPILIAPAMSSATPPRTTSLEDPRPDRPAVNAKGTVRPSESPIMLKAENEHTVHEPEIHGERVKRELA